MSKKVAQQSASVIYLQQDGAFTASAPFERGQAGLGDITLPGPGDRTVFFFTDEFGNPIPGGAERAAPGQPSTSVDNYFGYARSILEKIAREGGCRNLQFRLYDCGSLDNPGAWTRIIHLGQVQTGDLTISAPVSREFSDARIEMSTPANAIYWIDWSEQALTSLTTTEITSLTGVTFMSAPQGCDNCGNGYPGPDKIGYITTEADTGVTANILYTNDGGSTWTATSADPFGADEHSSFPVLRPLNKTQLRLIVGRTVTDAAAAAEIAHTDVTLGDEGTTVWTSVDVGATNGDVINSIFWPQFDRLYVGFGGGDIALSTDQGESFSVIYTGAQAINQFAQAPNGDVYACGATGTLLLERSASGTFAAITDPTGTDASTAIAIANDGTIWLGNGTSLWYTTNSVPTATTDWTSVKDFTTNHQVIAIHPKGGVQAMGGDSQVLHVVVNDTSAGEGDVWLTADGTYFQEVTNLTNSGYLAAYFSSLNDNWGTIVGTANATPLGVIHRLNAKIGV